MLSKIEKGEFGEDIKMSFMFVCLDVWTFGGWDVGRFGRLGAGRRVTLSLAKGLSNISWIDGSRGSRFFAVLRMTGR